MGIEHDLASAGRTGASAGTASRRPAACAGSGAPRNSPRQAPGRARKEPIRRDATTVHVPSFEGSSGAPAIMRRPSDGATRDAAPCPGIEHHLRVPLTPAPRQWSFEPPPDDHPEDLWALGADLEPGTLLAAYRSGLFPMPIGPRLGWFSPTAARIVALDSFGAVPLAPPCDTRARDSSRHRLRRRRRRLCAARRSAQLDRRRDRGRILRPARTRLGALRRGVGRRGARRRALRSLDRWPVRG